jgi:hypothetical protein
LQEANIMFSGDNCAFIEFSTNNFFE